LLKAKSFPIYAISGSKALALPKDKISLKALIPLGETKVSLPK